MIQASVEFDRNFLQALNPNKIKRETQLFSASFGEVVRQEYARADFGNSLIGALNEYPPPRTESPFWKSRAQMKAAVARMKASGRVQSVNGRPKYRRSYEYQNGWVVDLTQNGDGYEIRVYNSVEYGAYVGGVLVLYGGTTQTISNVEQGFNAVDLSGSDWQQPFHFDWGWPKTAPIVQASFDRFVARVIQRFNARVASLASRGELYVGVRALPQTGLQGTDPQLGLGRPNWGQL